MLAERSNVLRQAHSTLTANISFLQLLVNASVQARRSKVRLAAMLRLGTRFLFFKLCGSKVIWLDYSPTSTCTYTPTSLINCNSSTNFSTISNSKSQP